MSPYEQLMIGLGAPVQKDWNFTPDVAQNIGKDKLAKQPYNPYGLIKLNPEAKPENDQEPQGFTQQVLKDAKET